MLSVRTPGGSEERWNTGAEALGRASRTPTGNGLDFRRPGRLWPARDSGFAATEEELMLTLPGPECPAGGVPVRTARSGTLLPLGRTAAGIVVGPELDRDQGRHMAVLGETGMGKSSLLVALARRASRGHGLVLFDPLGETVEALAQELGPSDTERLVRIDPVRHPVEINALEGILPDGRDAVRSERRLNDLVHALRRVRAGRYTDSGFWGPRLEEMLLRAVRAAASLERGTLVEAHTLLATRARAPRDSPSQAMGPIRELAERVRERPEDAEGARRLLYEVVRSPVLARMLCSERPEVATRELVRPGRIVLLSGGAASVGESTARYLLSVYLALVWSELLARREAAKTFVVLDEAQWFSHESLAEMLRLGRRANVHVVLATQAVASLPETVAEAVWTNVADFVAFRGSPAEAREFSRVARGLAPDAILSLPRGEAAVLIGKGHDVRWVRTIRRPGLLGPRVPDDAAGSEPGEGQPPSPGTRPFPGEAEAMVDGGGAAAPPPDVLGWLRDRMSDGSPDGIVRVSLELLRREVDPGGEVVRRVGAALGRSGVLLATERSTEGAVWLLARDRFLAWESEVSPPVAGGSSHAPQPS